MERNSTCISHTSHFFVIPFVGEGFGDFVGEIEGSTGSEIGGGVSHELGNFVESIFNLGFNVVPEFIHEDVELVFKKRTVGESHLIHGAINVEKFHGGGVLTDFVQVTVLVGFEVTGLGCPDGFRVDVVISWFAMTVGTVGRGKD